MSKLKQVPIHACVFRAQVRLADPQIDEEAKPEEDDADMADGENTDGEDSEEDSESADSEDAAEGEADGDGEAAASDRSRFKVVANSGKPMHNVPWWGTLGIDLKGIRAKDRVPALLEHDVTQRIGVFEQRAITADGLVMTGQFLPRSELAARVDQELRDGFPWEASVRLHPLKVQELAAGESAIVNGHTLNGPAFLFLESDLREASLVALGHDPYTSAAALSSESPELQVEFLGSATRQDQKMTTTETEKDPAAIARQAVADERKRIATLQQMALPEQAELCQRLINEGADLAAASEALRADLRVRFEALNAQMKRGDASLARGERQQQGSPIARVRQLPDSPAKFKKLYELDPELQAEFTSAEAFVAFSMESVNR